MAKTKVDRPALNSDARAPAIRDGFARIYALENSIDAIREEHLTPLTKSRTKVWRTLKADLDITREVLENEYKRYKLARQAQENEEDDHTLDDMREVFLALHPGSEIDWVKTLQNLDVQPKQELVAPEIAREQGKKAGLAGKNAESNPYSDDTKAFDEWSFGWQDGQKELVAKMGNTEAVAAS